MTLVISQSHLLVHTILKAVGAAYRMIYVEESSACGQLVGLFNLFNSSDRQEHTNWGAQGKETYWLKVQGRVDNRHLQNKTTNLSIYLPKNTQKKKS